MDCGTPGFPILHYLPEFPQTHVHWVDDAIQPSHLLSSPSPPALNLSQHQSLFQWVGSLHPVAKVLEFQHQSFQWMFRTDFLRDWQVGSPCSPKDSQVQWYWSWNSSNLATWCEELTHLKRPWCWERFKAGGEGDYRGWDGWMASPTQCTWIWVNSWSCWQTRRPGMLHSMGLRRVRHDWATEFNWLLSH